MTIERNMTELNESLQDIKKLVWPNLSVADVVRFMRFSPAWKPALEKVEIETDLTDAQREQAVAAVDQMYRNDLDEPNFSDDVRDSLVEIKPLREKAKSGGIRLTGEKALIDGFMSVMPNLKLDKATKRVGDGAVRIDGQPEQQRKAFKLFKTMSSDPEKAKAMSDLSAKVVELMRKMKDKGLPPEQKKDVISGMKETGAALKALLDPISGADLTRDEQQEFEKTQDGGETGPEKHRISGYFAPVSLAYAICRLIQKNRDPAIYLRE